MAPKRESNDGERNKRNRPRPHPVNNHENEGDSSSPPSLPVPLGDSNNENNGEDFDIMRLIHQFDHDAVDFEPLLTNHAGTAINYHQNDHREHQKLLKKGGSWHSSFDENDQDGNRSRANSCSGRASPVGVSSQAYLIPGLHRLRLGMSRFSSWLTTKPSSSSQQQRQSGSIFREPSRGSNDADESDEPRRYLATFMLTFVFIVLISNFMNESTSHANNAFRPAAAGDTRSVNQEYLPPPPEESRTAQIVKVEHAPKGTIFPPDVRRAYKDTDDLPMEMMDTPVFWQIPRSGSTTLKLIFSQCMGKVLASEQGAGHQLDEQLEIIQKDFGNFANVDTTTVLGLRRARELGLVPSRTVDVVVTPHIRQATMLFDKHHKGRLFAMFRHPADRLVSLYYFLRMPNQRNPNVANMTLEEFAFGYGENWMVRTLTNTMEGELEDSHLHIAKEILRRKFLIGLLEEKTESLRRIQDYFGFKLVSTVSQTCKNNMFYFEPSSKNPHPKLDPASEAYGILETRNRYDFELYEYAKFLFGQQGKLEGRAK